MANGFALSVKMKLFDPIGLGSLLDVIFLDEHKDGIDSYLPTEKDVARPFKGKMWISASITYGHFNGPKRKAAIVTDGIEVFEVGTGTYQTALTNKHKANPALRKFVLKQIGERLFWP